MAYEFHYTQTGTGVISGKEVLEQTEDAINDLGNTAISGVQEALDKAEQALTNSENAVDDAQTALNTANNAEGVAIQAQTDVGNLSGTVTNIGNRVTTAEGNISNLQGRMTTAEGNITNIQGRMTTAETNIGNLQTAVSTAQATANSAQQTATTARQQSYVFRYSGTAVVPNSTIAYSTIDNTDNIKSGDKILAVDGKLFGITAVDTTNQTVTVGSALIDLALDSDVVHKSGNETIGGTKTFDSNTYIYNSDNTATTPSLILKNSKTSKGSTSEIGGQLFRFFDKNNNLLSEIESTVTSNGASELRLSSNTLDSNNQNVKTGLTLISNKNGIKRFCPTDDGNVSCGYSTLKWSGVYATNYYYGANNVEFSTKFVTTDTAQTISGAKTFSSNINVYNSDSTTDTANIILKNSKAEVGTEFSEQSVNFVDKNNNPLAKISCYGSGGSYTRLYITAYDPNNNSDGFFIRKSPSGTAILPTTASAVAIGNSTLPYYNVQTNRVNGLTPSSLSMPGYTLPRIDISGYITDLTGRDNNYTVPANGYVFVRSLNSTYIKLLDYPSGVCSCVCSQTADDIGTFIPVIANRICIISIKCSSIDRAYFIPCQGNI